jgi:hypothetical protein
MLSIKYLQYLQNIVFGKENDLLFSLPLSMIFPFSISFALLFLAELIWELLMKIPTIRKKIVVYEEKKLTIEEEKYFKKLNIKYNVFVILVFLTLVFISISAFSLYFRVNNEGVYYTKMFSFKESKLDWSELKEVTFSLGKDEISPIITLDFGDNKFKMLDGLGLGSPASQAILKTIDIVRYKTNAPINVEKNIREKNELNNTVDWKKNYINNVLDYVWPKEKEQSEKPDLILENVERIRDGSGGNHQN